MILRGWFAIAIVWAAAVWATTAVAEIRIATAGPMTGSQSWFGEQFERGAGMAAADLSGKGGLLGQEVELVVGDDFCDPDQAVAAANKLVNDGVVFVVGHWCSHSSIAASTVYEEAQVLMIISPTLLNMNTLLCAYS
jgi:branched-chain amino acid transport system substrate-binding protein